MEFVLGYMLGSGVNWQTIAATIGICFVIAVIVEVFRNK